MRGSAINTKMFLKVFHSLQLFKETSKERSMEKSGVTLVVVDLGIYQLPT